MRKTSIISKGSFLLHRTTSLRWTMPWCPRRPNALMCGTLSDEWVTIQGIFWCWSDGEWARETSERMGFLESAFWHTITGGRRGLSILQIKEIGRDASLTYPMAVHAQTFQVETFFHEMSATHLCITTDTGPSFRNNNLYSHSCRHITSVILSCSLGSTVLLADFAFTRLSMLIFQEERNLRS